MPFPADFYWLLPAALAIYLLGVPLVILATFRYEADPELESVDDDVPLPEHVCRHFEDVAAALQELGFESGDMLYLPHQIDNVKAILQLFVNHQDRSMAMGVTMFTLLFGHWKIGNQYVEFSTQHGDGREANSTNTTEVGAFPPMEAKITHWLSCFRDLRQLYSAHCAMSDAHAPFESRIVRLESEFGGDTAAFIAACLQAEFEQAASCGYLRRTNDGTHYRATIAGAYKMTWKQLPPFKGLIRRHMTHKALDQLAAIGWNADAPNPAIPSQRRPPL